MQDNIKEVLKILWDESRLPSIAFINLYSGGKLYAEMARIDLKYKEIFLQGDLNVTFLLYVFFLKEKRINFQVYKYFVEGIRLLLPVVDS